MNDLRVKAKFDTALNAEVFADINLGSGVSVSTCIGGNLREENKSGFMGTPMNIGFKVLYLD